MSEPIKIVWRRAHTRRTELHEGRIAGALVAWMQKIEHPRFGQFGPRESPAWIWIAGNPDLGVPQMNSRQLGSGSDGLYETLADAKRAANAYVRRHITKAREMNGA